MGMCVRKSMISCHQITRTRLSIAAPSCCPAFQMGSGEEPRGRDRASCTPKTLSPSIFITREPRRAHTDIPTP